MNRYVVENLPNNILCAGVFDGHGGTECSEYCAHNLKVGLCYIYVGTLSQIFKMLHIYVIVRYLLAPLFSTLSFVIFYRKMLYLTTAFCMILVDISDLIFYPIQI